MFGFYVCAACCFRRGKSAKINCLWPDSNRCAPFAVTRVNAKNAGFVLRLWALQVLRVDMHRCLAQVIRSSIGAVAVNVVNMLCWPSAVHVNPRNPVSEEEKAIDADSRVTVPRANTSSALPYSPSILMFGGPRKDAGFRVVMQKLSDAFCGKIGLSHDALHSLSGQGRWGVTSTAGASSL